MQVKPNDVADVLGFGWGRHYGDGMGGPLNFPAHGCRAVFALYHNGMDTAKAAVDAFRELAKQAGAYLAAYCKFVEKPAFGSPAELWCASLHDLLRDSPFVAHLAVPNERNVAYRPFVASIELCEVSANRRTHSRFTIGNHHVQQANDSDGMNQWRPKRKPKPSLIPNSSALV